MRIKEWEWESVGEGAVTTVGGGGKFHPWISFLYEGFLWRTRKANAIANILSCLRRLSIGCCCLLLLAGCQFKNSPTGKIVTVRVHRVVSGQTLDVLNPTQQKALIERVRLIGIEAPDLKQDPWGSAARNRFEQMMSQANNQPSGLQPVILELEQDIPEKDSAGRWLAYVWCDGRLINEELVKEGYVLAAPRSPNKKYDTRFARAQEYARLMGYGIWSPSQPMRLTPAEFRRQNP